MDNQNNFQQNNQTSTLPQDYQSLLEKLKEKVTREAKPSTAITTLQEQIEKNQPREEESFKETQIPEPSISLPEPQNYPEVSNSSEPDQTRQEVSQQESEPINQEENPNQVPVEPVVFIPQVTQEKTEEEPIVSYESLSQPTKTLDTTKSAEARQLAENLAESLKTIESLLANKELIEKELEALQSKKSELDKEIENKRNEISQLTEKINQIVG